MENKLVFNTLPTCFG